MRPVKKTPEKPKRALEVGVGDEILCQIRFCMDGREHVLRLLADQTLMPVPGGAAAKLWHSVSFTMYK